MDLNVAEGILREAIEARVCSAAQLEVRSGSRAGALALGTTGTTADAVSVPVTRETIFDLASVTKAVCTALLGMRAVEAGLLSLDDRAPRDISVAQPTLRDLLRHTSGLPAYARVWRTARHARDPREYAERRFGTAAPSMPIGTPCYSDLGFVALGRWVAAVEGRGLDEAFAEEIAGPLGLTSAHFGDGRAARRPLADYAATERCPWRDATLQGVVHDENCQVLGGVAGHAGLFATAREVMAIADSLTGRGPRILAPATVDAMWAIDMRVDGGTHVLGWDTPTGPRSNAGTVMTRGATFGHLGFTGTSVWIDRARDVTIVLLTNRVHPTRAGDGIRALRPALQDAVMAALGYEVSG